LVEVQVGQKDRRERHLYLTETGQSLEQELSNAQRARMRSAYRDVGADAVSGFRQVLEAMMDPEMKRAYWKLRDNEGMDK
jgi:DNA-binding MarR family transcriptional regulator